MWRKSIVLIWCVFAIAGPWTSQAAPANAPRLSEFGVNSHLASRYGNYTAMPWPADTVASTGAGWVREDFQWFEIEPTPGHFQWTFFDRMVDLMMARGMNIIGVLGYPPGWGTPEPSDNPSEVSYFAPDPVSFAAFAAAVVNRYRYRVVHWEIWNEPDNPQFWRPHPDPVAYARLLSTVYPVISTVAPEANVLLGGINPFDNRFLQTIADVGSWWAFDIINIHPYVNPATPEANGGMGAVARANIQQVMSVAGEKPVWATEYGWTTRPDERDPLGSTSEEDQANYLVRGAVLLRAAGVEQVLVYSLKDEVHNGYGLLRFGRSYDDSSQPRPAFGAFVTLNGQLGRTAFVRTLDTINVLDGGPVYAYRFARNGEAIDVIWALTRSTIQIPTDRPGVAITNRSGNSWIVPAEAGSVTLYPNGSPIYVRQL